MEAMNVLLNLISKFMVIAFPVAFTLALIEKITLFTINMFLGKGKITL